MRIVLFAFALLFCGLSALSSQALNLPLASEPRYQAELGWFIQGDTITEKNLQNVSQLPDFGAIQPWQAVHKHLKKHPRSRKLLYLIRHGQGVHNLVLSIVGSYLWDSKISKQCSYEQYNIFDPSLTDLGNQQSAQLNQILKSNDTLRLLLNGNQFQYGIIDEMNFSGLSDEDDDDDDDDGKPLVFVSPLARTTETALTVFKDIPLKTGKFIAIEHLRESTEGGHPCDARKSIKDPADGLGHNGNCTFTKGYTSIYGDQVQYPILQHGQGLGMWSGADEFFSQDRPETKKLLELRAAGFIQSLFDNYPEDQVVFSVSHSGTISAIMETLGLKSYETANAELVPVMIRNMRP